MRARRKHLIEGPSDNKRQDFKKHLEQFSDDEIETELAKLKKKVGK